jgi:hypothetical protein
VSISLYFVSQDQATQTLTVIAVQFVTEGKVSLLVSGELDNDHCDALLQIYKKQRLDSLLMFSFRVC